MITTIIAAGGLIISILSLSFSFYQYKKENAAEMIGHLSEPEKYGEDLDLIIRNVGKGVAVDVEIELLPPLPAKVKAPTKNGVLDLTELINHRKKYSELFNNGVVRIDGSFFVGLESLKLTDKALGDKIIKMWLPDQVSKLPYYMFTSEEVHKDPNGRSKNGVPNNSEVIIKWKNYGSLLPLKHKKSFPLDVSSASLTGFLNDDTEREKLINKDRKILDGEYESDNF